MWVVAKNKKKKECIHLIIIKKSVFNSGLLFRETNGCQHLYHGTSWEKAVQEKVNENT